MKRAMVLIAWTAAASSVGTAQERIWYADGQGADDRFGIAVELLPDLDADGVQEVLIGASAHWCGGISHSGIAYELSTSGGELNEWCGEGDEERLGGALAAIGDVDHDGVDDFAVGAPGYYDPSLGPNTGRVFVISAKTGTTLLEIHGDFPGSTFGSALAGLPDLNGDSYPEIIVGEPYYGLAIGKAFVISTKDGSKLRTYSGAADYVRLGANVAALGDVDGDGVKDYAIHAIMPIFERGKIWVYSGASGALIWSIRGPYDLDHLGVSIADGGDIDGDGYPDVLCGGRSGPAFGGHFDGYSGKTGALLFRIESTQTSEQFGQSCAMVGDANGDGVGDYLVGAISTNYTTNRVGRATLFSGKTLRPIYTFYPDDNETSFGYVVRGGIDLNRDGISDFVISGIAGIAPGPSGGRVSIFAGNDLYLQADEPNPIPGDFVTFDTRGGVPGSFAELVLVDVNGTPVFAPLDYGFLDANGELASTLCVPDDATGLYFTVISYAVKLTHKPKWNDSSPVVISVQ